MSPRGSDFKAVPNRAFGDIDVQRSDAQSSLYSVVLC
jgi:hypothetical protein